MLRKFLLVFLFVTTFLLGYAYHSLLHPYSSQPTTMKRVTGIGGIFFKARDPEALYAWYERHLGLRRNSQTASAALLP